MIYEIPPILQANTVSWPTGCGNVPAIDAQGNERNVPIIRDCSMAVFGQPGYGKTVFIMNAAKALLTEPGNRRTVFFQAKPDDYTGAFLRSDDRIVTYSPSLFPNHIFRWNMIREFRQAEDSDALMKKVAALLFSDILEDPRNAIWAGPAAETFCAFCRVILKRYRNCPTNREVIMAMKNLPANKLLDHIAMLPEHYGMLQSYFDYEIHSSRNYHMTRKGADIRFVFNQALEKFSGTFLNGDGNDTIHDFLAGNGDKRLFILHDDGSAEVSAVFEKLFLELIISHQLSLSVPVSSKADLLMVLDEVDKLDEDFGLLRAVNQGREQHLQVILSTQSVENLYAIAPKKYAEHLTTAMLTGFPMTVFFHPGDEASRKAAQGLYGTTRKQTLLMPISRYEKPISAIDTMPCVTDEDFSLLGIGDCYVKVRNAAPVWVHISKE